MLSAEHLGGAGRRGLGRPTLAGTALAVVGVGACFVVASLAGAALMVAVRGSGATSVPFGAAVSATVAAGGGAYVLARLAGRASRPRRMFLLWATAGLLASAVPPLQAATGVSTLIWLLVMHVVAALALVPVVASGLLTARPAGEPQVPGHLSTQVAGSASSERNL